MKPIFAWRQNAIGIGVLGGMLTATFLGIYFVPVFFVLVRGYFGSKTRLRDRLASHSKDDN